MNVFRKLVATICTLLFSFVIFCARSEAQNNLPNILLFTIDACRPDHFGCYDYQYDTTPHIDALARKGFLFTRAFSQSAWTTPGMISIFTSLYPHVHTVDAKGKTLDEDILTLPDILKTNGYKVPVLPRFVDIPNYWHLGFDMVSKEQFQGEERGEGEDLLKLLEAYKDQKFFIWYHYHSLHLPYNPQSPYDKMFSQHIEKSTSADSEAVATVKKRSVIKAGSIGFNDNDKETVIALYDGQLRVLDDYIGRLVEKMKAWNILDNTIIIITSDHGEELFEHGFIGHASTSLNAKLYDEIIHVPLIILWPKLLKPGISDELVQQIDIMPTLLEMLGIPEPSGLQGRSLFSVIRGTSGTKSHPVFSETILGGYQSTREMEEIKLQCIRTNEWKLIRTTGTGSDRYELYNMNKDQAEKRNVIENYPSVSNGLVKELLRWTKTATLTGNDSPSSP